MKYILTAIVDDIQQYFVEYLNGIPQFIVDKNLASYYGNIDEVRAQCHRLKYTVIALNLNVKNIAIVNVELENYIL